MKKGDEFGVYEAIIQPHDYYPPIGTTFLAKKVTDLLIFPVKVCDFDDIYFYHGECKKVGTCRINELL